MRNRKEKGGRQLPPNRKMSKQRIASREEVREMYLVDLSQLDMEKIKTPEEMLFAIAELPILNLEKTLDATAKENYKKGRKEGFIAGWEARDKDVSTGRTNGKGNY